MQTVPNQRIMVIHREKPEKDFLQIKNENWHNFLIHTQNDYPALVLYLYLAANANNYSFALSPRAVEEATGLPRSTFYKKLKILVDKGYIIEGKSNILHFYEATQKKEEQEILRARLCGKHDIPPQTHENPLGNTSNLAQSQSSSSQNIEIDNKYITDKEQIKHTTKLSPKEEEFNF